MQHAQPPRSHERVVTSPGGASPRSDNLASTLTLLTACTAVAHLAVGLLLPSLSAIAADMAMPPELAGLTISALLLGVAAGQLIIGPISDVYGRRPVLLFCLGACIVAGVAATITTDASLFIVARFVQGLGASAGVVLPRAIARDRYDGPLFYRSINLLTGTQAITPAVAPLLGALVDSAFGWRGSSSMCVTFSIIVLGFVFFALPESHHLNPQSERGLAGACRSYVNVFRRRAFTRLVLPATLVVAGSYLPLASAFPVLTGEFGWSPFMTGIASAVYAAAFITGTLVGGGNGTLGRARIIVASLILIGLPSTLLCLWSLGSAIEAIFFVIYALVQVGVGIALPGLIAEALFVARDEAGAASAVLGGLQMISGALIMGLVGAFPPPIGLSATIAMLALYAPGVVMLMRRGGMASVSLAARIATGRRNDAECVESSRKEKRN